MPGRKPVSAARAFLLEGNSTEEARSVEWVMKSVFISAGHSGSDPGACANNHREADLAVWLRDQIAAILRGRVVPVVIDGQPGQNLHLREAVQLVRANEGPAVEIHFNAGGARAAGVEVLSKPAHKALAKELARAISTVTQSPLRGEQGWKADNSGQHHRLAFCEAGGLVVEVCFISNAADLNAYLNKRNEVAVALADVLERASKQGIPKSA